MTEQVPTLKSSEFDGIELRRKQSVAWHVDVSSRFGHIAVAILLGVGFLALWEFAARRGLLEPVLFPPPTMTVEAFVFLLQQDYFAMHFTVTLYEIIVGYGLGVSIGLVLGILLATIGLIRRTVYPYVIAFQALPKVVLAPLFIVWFGFGPESKIATAAAICFFPVLVNTLVGLQLVEENAVKLMRSLHASWWQMFTKLRFPNALPQIFAGLKTSFTYAMVGAIVAEYLTGASNGLGRLIQIYNLQIQVHRELAVVVIISAFGIIGVILMDLLDRKIVFWRKGDEQSLT